MYLKTQRKELLLTPLKFLCSGVVEASSSVSYHSNFLVGIICQLSTALTLITDSLFLYAYQAPGKKKLNKLDSGAAVLIDLTIERFGK